MNTSDKIYRDIEKEAEKAGRSLERKGKSIRRSRRKGGKKSEYQKKLDKYRKITGRKRVSKNEKELLRKYSVAQVKKSLTLKESTHKRRIREYEKKIGRKASEGEKEELRYLTANELFKERGKEDDKDGGAGEGKEEWAEFSDVSISFDWYDLPPYIRTLGRHSSGIMYRNQELFWGRGFRLPEDIIGMSDGNDMSVYGFLRAVFAGGTRMSKRITYDPGNTGVIDMLILRDEWSNVDSLHPDFKNNKLYKPKDWSRVPDGKRIVM